MSGVRITMLVRLRGRGRRDAADGGFTLLEVIAALMVLGLAAGAVALQAFGSARAGGRAKVIAQAKGVVHGQLDAMRTMPFAIAPSAGDHVDLLDRYYPDLTSPPVAPGCAATSPAALPGVGWVGYVPAAAPRCA